MTGISNLKDGNFYFIQKLDTLDECFVDALGGLVSVVAEKITISVLFGYQQNYRFLAKPNLHSTRYPSINITGKIGNKTEDSTISPFNI
jgi:hypothetical protein